MLPWCGQTVFCLSHSAKSVFENYTNGKHRHTSQDELMQSLKVNSVCHTVWKSSPVQCGTWGLKKSCQVRFGWDAELRLVRQGSRTYDHCCWAPIWSFPASIYFLSKGEMSHRFDFLYLLLQATRRSTLLSDISYLCLIGPPDMVVSLETPGIRTLYEKKRDWHIQYRYTHSASTYFHLQAISPKREL